MMEYEKIWWFHDPFFVLYLYLVTYVNNVYIEFSTFEDIVADLNIFGTFLMAIVTGNKIGIEELIKQ